MLLLYLITAGTAVTLVGWAGEPVPSIDEKDFGKMSIYPRHN
jgi:hypothetical protein